MGGKKQKKPSKRRLRSLEDARRFLAAIINDVHMDSIDPTKGSKLAYMIQILGRLIEGSDLEKRVQVLEQAIMDKEK